MLVKRCGKQELTVHNFFCCFEISESTPVPVICNCFCKVYKHTQRLIQKKTHPKTIHVHFLPESSIHPEQYSLTTLRSVLESFQWVVKCHSSKKIWDQLFLPWSFFWLLLLSSSLAVCCSSMSYFWPFTLIRSLWPKQGTGLLCLQHASISVWIEKSWLWDTAFGSSEALRLAFTQNLCWDTMYEVKLQNLGYKIPSLYSSVLNLGFVSTYMVVFLLTSH